MPAADDLTQSTARERPASSLLSAAFDEGQRSIRRNLMTPRLDWRIPQQPARLPTDRFLVWRLKLGPKTLRFWRGNYSNRRFLPFVEHYPFRSWTLSWRWGRLGWTLSRWD